MVAPPNAVVPNSMPRGLTRYHSEESLEEFDDESVETSPVSSVKERKAESPPPNHVAPPSQPVKFNPHSAVTPTTPLAVNMPLPIPRGPSTAIQPESELFQMTPVPSQWGVSDVGQWYRDLYVYGDQTDPQTYYMGLTPTTSHSDTTTDAKAVNVNSGHRTTENLCSISGSVWPFDDPRRL